MRIDYPVRPNKYWVVLLIFFPLLGRGQNQEDLKVLSRAFNKAKESYFNSMGSEVGLYNGVFYKEYAQHSNDEGQPYFETDQWVESNLFYNGMYYENVPLLYDEVNDKVIIDHTYGAVKLELISEKIKYFDINHHRFVNLIVANTNSPVRTGFFELLYDGQSKLYAKWQKKRIEVIVEKDLQVRYEDQNRIYLFKDNVFHAVKSKSSVLHVLEDKKPLLQKYIKKNHLRFKSQRIESIVKVMAFYESGTE